MGLKSKLNKMKNFLFDEEEVEKPDKKKEKVKVKKGIVEKLPEKKEEEKPQVDTNDFYFDDISDVPDETIEVKSRVSKESTFSFPEYNDNDFMTPASSVVKEEKTVEVTKVSDGKPVLLYQGSKRREETKRFKPSPIISPIYGLLDESGNKVEKNDSRDERGYKNKKVSEFDEVRNRAYGKELDEKLENTMSRLSGKTIEEAEREMQIKEKKIKGDDVKKKKDDSDDDMILPDISFKEIDIDRITKESNKKKVIEDDDEDTKEQDLFNLIDTIYAKEGKDE